jgi:transcriptional regulator with XRE-family HTH domain
MLSLVESGRREPTIKLLRDVARALEIPAAALFAVALEEDEAQGDSPSPELERFRAMNVDLLAAVQHSIVLRRLQHARKHG